MTTHIQGSKKTHFATAVDWLQWLRCWSAFSKTTLYQVVRIIIINQNDGI